MHIYSQRAPASLQDNEATRSHNAQSHRQLDFQVRARLWQRCELHAFLGLHADLS